MIQKDGYGKPKKFSNPLGAPVAVVYRWYAFSGFTTYPIELVIGADIAPYLKQRSNHAQIR
jgi:hypothetical protein